MPFVGLRIAIYSFHNGDTHKMKNELDLFRGNFWNPTRDMSSLQKEVNRIFDSFFHPMQSKDKGELSFTPACDVEESDSQLLMTFDLPGVPKENIKIEIHERELVVSGERTEERKEDKKSRHYVERLHGSFKRTFTLPSSIDTNKIDASYENGILRVILPKAEAIKPKQVKISEGKESKTQVSPSQNGTKIKEGNPNANRVA